MNSKGQCISKSQKKTVSKLTGIFAQSNGNQWGRDSIIQTPLHASFGYIHLVGLSIIRII